MVLRVPFEEFPDAIRRELGTSEAYVASFGRGAISTAHVEGRTVESESRFPAEETRARLREAGLQAHRGRWSTGDDSIGEETPNPTIVAIAYSAQEGRAGLWVDAFDEPPTPNQALKAMYEEFLSNGEMADATFERFMDQARPTVVVLGPEEARRFAQEKRDAEGSAGP